MRGTVQVSGIRRTVVGTMVWDMDEIAAARRDNGPEAALTLQVRRLRPAPLTDCIRREFQLPGEGGRVGHEGWRPSLVAASTERASWVDQSGVSVESAGWESSADVDGSMPSLVAAQLASRFRASWEGEAGSAE
ncbi:UNVERIFIED_CONTAM: hypothetical protein RKD50_009409 [Streptomyces canus]